MSNEHEHEHSSDVYNFALGYSIMNTENIHFWKILQGKKTLYLLNWNHKSHFEKLNEWNKKNRSLSIL